MIDKFTSAVVPLLIGHPFCNKIKYDLIRGWPLLRDNLAHTKNVVFNYLKASEIQHDKMEGIGEWGRGLISGGIL